MGFLRGSDNCQQAIIAVSTLILGAACGGGGGVTGSTATDSLGTLTSEGTTGTSTSTGPSTDESSGPSSDESSDTTSGDCVGPDCCDEGEQRCGGVCCSATDVCSFGECIAPGAECQDPLDCPKGEYCDLGIGSGDNDPPVGGKNCVDGYVPPTGRCLPEPPACPDGVEPDPENPSCVAMCEVVPPFPGFAPTLKYGWGDFNASDDFSRDIRVAPLVIQLDDDDCDGEVTERDVAEIVVLTTEDDQTGFVHALSVEGGTLVEKWSAGPVAGVRNLAAGNVDGAPGNEVIACLGGNAGVVAYAGDGSEVWRLETNLRCVRPLIADIDGDGVPEVIVEDAIIDGATGAIEVDLTGRGIVSPIVADVSGDAMPEIIANGRIFDAMGEIIAMLPFAGFETAVGDFDLDGEPDLVIVDRAATTIAILRADATAPGGFAIVRDDIDVNAGVDPTTICTNPDQSGYDEGGGPPTIADVNGDGTPDVAVAGGVGYIVLDGVLLMNPATPSTDVFLWSTVTNDCSSARTGSTVFDFNGDGAVEVLYADETYFRIYDGDEGTELFRTCNTSGTTDEYPVVADVDADGQADIVVTSNGRFQSIDCEGTYQSGVRVFGTAEDAGWVRTPSIWNQHAYHVSNINEDGNVPTPAADNWTTPGLNNFRQNKQPGQEFAAPDAIVFLTTVCGPQTQDLVATVRNMGQAPLHAGATVEFFAGSGGAGGTSLGTAVTTQLLYPAQTEVVEITVDSTQLEVSGNIAYAVVTPAAEGAPECREGNNVSADAEVDCVIAG